MRLLRSALRALVLLVLAGLVLPASGVRPTTITLSRVENVKAIDFDDGIVWVLVLGSDAKGGTPIRKGNTDAIQLLGIDFDSGAAAAIGVPRDSWVVLPGVGGQRINAAMGEGGEAMVVDAVETLTGIRAEYVLVTEMNGFIAMTDAIGGVEVVSGEAFTTDSGEVEVRRGANRFDGRQALDYARTRRNLGSDLDRAANHQALLLGYLRQLRAHEDEAGFMERATFAALGGIDTALVPTDLYRLGQAVTQVDPRRVTGCIVTGRFDVGPVGESIVIPDEAQAQRLGRDAAADAVLDAGCNG